MDPRPFRYYGVEMGDARPVLPSSFGTVALVLVLALLALGAAILAGHAAATAAVDRSSTSELSINAPPSVWALLFFLPLIVGFVTYLLRLILLSSNSWPARLGASLAMVLVVSLLLFLLIPSAPWLQNSSVTVGGKGTTTPGGVNGNLTGNGTGPGSGSGPGSGNGTVNGTAPGGGGGNGTGTGTGNGTGSGSGSGGGSGQGQGGTGGGGRGGTGTGSGGGGSGGSGGSGGTGGSGTGGSSNNGTGPGSGNRTGGCGGGTGPHLTVGPLARGSPITPANCTAGGGSGGHGGKGGGGTGGTAHNNSSAPLPRGTTPAPLVGFGVPNWVFLLAAVALAGAVAVLAIPGVLPRRRPRSVSPGTGAVVAPTAEATGLAVHDARIALESGEDPRESIVRLYCRLLGRVAPTADDLAAFTAEEIQQLRLAALPIPPVRAEAITRMFEEARYSSHPVGRPEAVRYAETMRAIEVDLRAVGARG